MTDTYKLLYQGQLGTAPATLATVGAAKQWIVKHISVVNMDTAARTFSLCRQGVNFSNQITSPTMSVPSFGMAEWDGTIAMNDSETIRGSGSVANQLTVTICGDEIG